MKNVILDRRRKPHHHGKFQREGVSWRRPDLDAGDKYPTKFLLVQDFLADLGGASNIELIALRRKAISMIVRS
jgi:hypothetical protein